MSSFMLAVSIFSSVSGFAMAPTKRLAASTFADQMNCAPIRDLPTFNCYGKISDDYIIPVSVKVKLALGNAINCKFINGSRNFGCDNIPAPHGAKSRWAPVYINVNNFRFEKTLASVYVEAMK